MYNEERVMHVFPICLPSILFLLQLSNLVYVVFNKRKLYHVFMELHKINVFFLRDFKVNKLKHTARIKSRSWVLIQTGQGCYFSFLFKSVQFKR